MKIIEIAETVLAEAETKLCALIIEATNARDYDAVAGLSQWVSRLKEMQAVGPQGTNGVVRGSRYDQFDDDDHSAPGQTPNDSVRRFPENGQDTKGVGFATARRRRSPSKGEYPKFFRRDDNLIKIGWSKKERREYEHKAPRSAVEALAAAIAQQASGAKRFTSEDLFTATRPLKDPHTGHDIPGYQAYVALAWLKSTGLVIRRDRKNYSAKNAAGLPSSAAESWQNLPESNE